MQLMLAYANPISTQKKASDMIIAAFLKGYNLFINFYLVD